MCFNSNFWGSFKKITSGDALLKITYGDSFKKSASGDIKSENSLWGYN